jgi:hypothetical protein
LETEVSDTVSTKYKNWTAYFKKAIIEDFGQDKFGAELPGDIADYLMKIGFFLKLFKFHKERNLLLLTLKKHNMLQRNCLQLQKIHLDTEF